MKTAGQQQQLTAKRTAPVLSLLGRTLIATLEMPVMSTLRHIADNGSKAYQAIASVQPAVLCTTFAAPINQHESSPNRFYGMDWTHANIRGGNP